MKVHLGVIPLCEDGTQERYQGIENNPWGFQEWGEGWQVGEGIGLFCQILIDMKEMSMSRDAFSKIGCVR